ncbi:uncharacterized protein H6S33_006881 [Morchella sextelata]|uniref:uncharacterized protein n=1 Tax=Morchella sextelata TaxID=1174677 RepID=UPI001D052969|nr:uncharacterized protein H6S33_006881 [Morchella sextelata]KAH0604504.1 hypothetical protein H6S33_006881 [Morchella sextelata]
MNFGVSAQRDQKLFESTLSKMNKIDYMMRNAGFTKETFINIDVPRDTVSEKEMDRLAILYCVVHMGESLGGVKEQYRWHGIISREAFDMVKKRRNSSGHDYEHPEKRMDYEDMWIFLTVDFVKIKAMIEEAIKILEDHLHSTEAEKTA